MTLWPIEITSSFLSRDGGYRHFQTLVMLILSLECGCHGPNTIDLDI